MSENIEVLYATVQERKTLKCPALQEYLPDEILIAWALTNDKDALT